MAEYCKNNVRECLSFFSFAVVKYLTKSDFKGENNSLGLQFQRDRGLVGRGYLGSKSGGLFCVRHLFYH